MSCVDAPSTVLSDPTGQIRAGGVQGWFHADRRVLSTLTVHVGGREATHLTTHLDDARSATFSGVLTHLGDVQTDPTVRLQRTRRVADARLEESVTVTSYARRDVEVDLQVRVAADLAAMADVRAGTGTEPLRPVARPDGLTWRGDEAGLDVTAQPPPDVADPADGVLRWRTTLRTGERLEIRLLATARAAAQFTRAPGRPCAVPDVTSPDPRVAALVSRGLDDVSGLALTDPDTSGVFVSAGSPWYLTLFGRDSLWAARMLLPLGTDLALSTLRVLAHRQGVRDDPRTEEQPGKILHEVRRGEHSVGAKALPPVYYGTVDATPLFVVLLAEAWRWGADAEQVRGLLPHATAALGWVERQADDGFIRYVDATGHGLTNQGWKDSDDGVQWADGRLADPPVALSEVQAYAYQAAVLGADLLDAFGEPGGAHWRSWAARMRARFREAFWVHDDRGRYPAVALDGRGRAVDGVASNMGHLLGTGLLDPPEAALVAARLASDDMSSGFGLRTLTSRSPRYSPLSYHGGSVWPHDTAVAIHGLSREGHRRAAADLLVGLIEAGAAFDHRLPELYSGDAATFGPPAPYPTSCRPQAWAAAAPLWAMLSVLGVDADVPRGAVRVADRAPRLPAVSLRGLRAGGHPLDVRTDPEGRVTAATRHPGLEVLSAP